MGLCVFPSFQTNIELIASEVVATYMSNSSLVLSFVRSGGELAKVLLQLIKEFLTFLHLGEVLHLPEGHEKGKVSLCILGDEPA